MSVKRLVHRVADDAPASVRHVGQHHGLDGGGFVRERGVKGDADIRAIWVSGEGRRALDGAMGS